MIEITSASLNKLMVLHEKIHIIYSRSSCSEATFNPLGDYVNEESLQAEGTADLSALSVKVMVIDDSKTIRRSAETLLKKVGCEVVTAVDGFEALDKNYHA